MSKTIKKKNKALLFGKPNSSSSSLTAKTFSCTMKTTEEKIVSK